LLPLAGNANNEDRKIIPGDGGDRSPAHSTEWSRSLRAIRIATGLAASMLLIGLSVGVAHADTGEDPLSPVTTKTTSPKTVVVGGHVLGAKDGVQVVTESYEITPGSGTVGATYPTTPPAGGITPMWVEGTSFAYSTELNYVDYRGNGKAGANVSNGKRIVEVCFWWTRTDGYRSSTTCSDANFNGGWVPGPEVIGWGKDTLDSYAPPTIFHISTVRIDPTAHW
jgi:hypothetical protein